MSERDGDLGGPARAVNRAVVAGRWLVITAWIAAVAAAIAYLPTMEGAGELGLPLPDDAAPLQAERAAAEAFGFPLVARTQVIVRDPDGLDLDAQAALARFAFDVTRGEEEGFAEVVAAAPITNAGGIAPGTGEEDTAVLTYLLMEPGATIPLQVTLAERYAARAPVPDGATVGITGSTQARDQQLTTVREHLPWVVLVTLALIVVIVALVLGSLAAPLVVLAVVGVAWVIAMRGIGWVSDLTGMSAGQDIEPVVSALLIGVVTDYAIFYLFGTRAQLRAEGDAPGARTRAAASAGAHYIAIVLTAGVTTALGTAALFAGSLDFFRAFAPALALTAIVAVVVSVTLLPAILGVLGRLAYWPRGVGDPSEPDPATDDGPSARTPLGARLLSTRPIAALTAVLVLAGLGSAAWQVSDLRLGLGLDTGVSAAVEDVDAAFAPGYRAPTELILQGRGATDAGALRQVGRALRARDDVAGVIGPGGPAGEVLTAAFVAEGDRTARFLLMLREEPTEHRAIGTLNDLRDAMPRLLVDAGLPDVRARWAGDTAIALSAVEAIDEEMVRVGVVALAVNLLLLILFLRALVAPLYLLLANVMSLAATLGLATLVFQEFLGDGQLVYYVPFAAAVLLLALGSDYNIYLMGQIWRLARGRGVRDGVRRAIPRGSRPIAVAGVVLAGTFSLLALVPVEAMRQFGFIMGVGALIDAFVVRTLLVPALVILFGRTGFWPGRPPERPGEPEGGRRGARRGGRLTLRRRAAADRGA